MVFEAFNRLKAEDANVEGTGIGLNIAQKLVHLMKGRIDFESELGKGSRFYIEMPLGETRNLEGDESNQLKDALQPEKESYRNFHILYIEDNPANLDLVAQALKMRKNHLLISASDAQTGIELAINNKPNLILMDINLPGMSGVEACRILKNNPQTANIPVIALSANAMDKDIEKSMEAGFLDYISKPINIMELLEKIDLTIM